MARLARVVVADVAQHVTQRGKGRQFLLANASERMIYLDLLRQAVRVEGVTVVGYCLMPNHVHLVVSPAAVHPHGGGRWDQQSSSAPSNIASSVGWLHRKEAVRENRSPTPGRKLSSSPNAPGKPPGCYPKRGTIRIMSRMSSEPVSFHVDFRYPYEDAVGMAIHVGSMMHSIWNSITRLF